MLPSHIEAVKKSGHPVIFCSDPMHGNTRSAAGGVKTRAMHDIVSEISASLRIHASMGSKLNGIHLELTGDITPEGESVTECTGGSMELAEEELALRFESYCDRELLSSKRSSSCADPPSLRSSAQLRAVTRCTLISAASPPRTR